LVDLNEKHTTMGVLISTIPVLLFLSFLFLLDSFKLVRRNWLLLALVWGFVSAGLAYVVNTGIVRVSGMLFDDYSRYLAPAIEELLKAAFIFLLLAKKKAGFLIDAAVYGFAVGAGFALVENSLYVYQNSDAGWLIWIIRGLGTAFMHGGCTALVAMMLIGAKLRGRHQPVAVVVAFVTVYLIHGLFNQFYVHPLLQTVGIVLTLPVFFVLLFNQSEKRVQNWLEMEFSSEVELLQAINSGRLLDTKAGDYLSLLRSSFQPEVIVDMYCYLRLYLELSVKAKRNLMLRENGFPPLQEADIADKLLEVKALRKRLGVVGERSLAPLIRMNYSTLWKLNQL
jgi:RsiW-degrading membrane proteinase PrsW (M82 family)